MLQRALERGHLDAGWVAGDDAFGMSPSFREGLAAQRMRYVLDVPGAPPCGRWSPLGATRTTRDSGVPASQSWWTDTAERSDELPEVAWREITVAEGSQGPRTYMLSASGYG